VYRGRVAMTQGLDDDDDDDVLARIVGAYTKAKGGDLFIGVTHVGDDAANSRTDFARRDPRFRRALFPRGRGTGGRESLAPGICLLVP